MQDRSIAKTEKLFVVTEKIIVFFLLFCLLGQLCLIEPEIFGSDLQTLKHI